MKASKIIGFVTVITLGLSQVVSAATLPSQAVSHMAVCPPGQINVAHCHARVVVDPHGKPKSTPTPAAYGPSELRGAYNLTGTAPTSQIIAIVDAYDDPTIQADLDTYSAKYGIASLPACTGPIAYSATPCFHKVDQNGGTNYPAVNGGWALEIALDVETAHAVCENCSILLVEANTAGLDDLGKSVNTAVALGANEVSNSYGTAGEFSTETNYDAYYNHPGVAVTVSSGDSGYGVEYPAASQYVTAVGGTSLYLNADKTWSSETAWSGAGSGCSSLESKVLGQPTVSGCNTRSVADISAVANPSTGVAIYDSTPYNGSTGWFKVGGTSLASPLIAAVYALAGGVSAGLQGNAYLYAHANTGNTHDITSGSNGQCGTTGHGKTAVGSALCNAIAGYDGPTGLGTPNGVSAF